MRVSELRGPADFAFVRLVRTMTLAVSAQADLSVDDADELRMAVDEACNALIKAGAVTLGVTFVESDVLTLTIRPTPQLSLAITPTTELILRTMTDAMMMQSDGTISLERRFSRNSADE